MALTAVGEWQATGCERYVTGVSTSSHSSSLLTGGNVSVCLEAENCTSSEMLLVARIPLFWGAREVEGLNMTTKSCQLVSNSTGKPVFFQRTERQFDDASKLFYDEESVNVLIQQCLT